MALSELSRTYSGNFTTNLSGWNSLSGRWLKTTDGYRVVRTGESSHYALSGTNVNSGVGFTLEADVKLLNTLPDGTNTVSLLFGGQPVNNSLDSGSYYTATIDYTNHFARIFRVDAGAITERIGSSYTLSAAQQASKTFRIKVKVNANKTMQLYIDNVLVSSSSSSSYSGGYIGLTTYNADAYFNNVTITYP